MRYLVIRTENLTKMYGRHLGVRDLMLEVEPGEIFGFLGPDGSGKTTTIRLLLDFVRPTSGRALVLGLDSRLDSLKVRRQVGYLPGEFDFFAHQTGRAALRSFENLRGKLDWAYVDGLIERFGLDVDQKIGDMPTLERRKVGLIQAFMHRPELILLDEPSRGLDLATQQALYQLIAEVRQEGRTVFLASNSVCEMERLCDRAAVLYGGQVMAVERGVHLRARALRRIEMRFATPVPLGAFDALPNLQDLHITPHSLSCTVRGDPDTLLKLASQYRITDMLSQSLSLEEVFRRDYGIVCAA